MATTVVDDRVQISPDAELRVDKLGFLTIRQELPARVWRRRHTGIVVLLWLHAVGVTAYALATGQSLTHSLIEGAVLAAAAVAAGIGGDDYRRLRSVVASLGLITASAVLVHLSGGYIEMHFHFFVMLAVIALYKDWLPYVLAVLYVAGHHGLVGTLTPRDVYNHAAAWKNPWLWALIHAVFVLGGSVAHVSGWQGERG